MNPYIMEVMLKERKKEMLIEAKRLQMLAAYEANRQSRRSKLLGALGKFLIAAGEKLTNRYAPENELQTS